MPFQPARILVCLINQHYALNSSSANCARYCHQVRWNIAVSPDTAQSLRMFLASQGGGRKGDLSRFIEEAVRAHILELTAGQVKAANADISEADLDALVEESVQWVRKA